MRLLATKSEASNPLSDLVSDGPMACVAETALAANFHFWRGASGRRYAVSVTKIEIRDAMDSLPDLDGFVLLAVARQDGKCWPVVAMAVERTMDRRAAVAAALAEGANEWHIHLLGTDRTSRTSIVADLKGRYSPEPKALFA